MLQVSIYRYNPDTDSEPYMKDYQIETGGKDFIIAHRKSFWCGSDVFDCVEVCKDLQQLATARSVNLLPMLAVASDLLKEIYLLASSSC